jgi:putative MFS transporter
VEQQPASTSVEDAPLNRFHKRLTLYSAGGPFLDGYVLTITGVVMAQIISTLSLNNSWTGLIAASGLIGVFFGGFLGGWFTDRFGRKTLYLIDLIAIIGLSAAQFWTQSAWMLFILRLALGMAVGADYPIATAFLAEFLPRKHRGPLLATMETMWFAGAACAYIAGSLIQHFSGEDAWRYALASALVPGILFLFARAGTPESPRWLLSKGRGQEAEAIIKRVYGDHYSLANISEPSAETQASMWDLFHSGYGRRMCFVAIFWTCAIVPLFAIYAFAPAVLGALGLGPDDAAMGSVAITVIFVVGCVLATKLVNLIGRRQTLIQSFLWSGVPLALLGFFSDAPPMIILLLFAAYAIGNGGSQVLQFIYPNELFPTEIRATAVGLGASLSRVGAVLGTYLVPVSLSTIGIGNTMLIAAGICFLGAWNAWAMAPETRQMDLTDAASLNR